jgi:hypothetical protein
MYRANEMPSFYLARARHAGRGGTVSLCRISSRPHYHQIQREILLLDSHGARQRNSPDTLMALQILCICKTKVTGSIGSYPGCSEPIVRHYGHMCVAT